MSTLCQIKASAGSGKTHALTRKYLSYLCSCKCCGPAEPLAGFSGETTPAAFGDILAITFTNAAVEEMRSRVLGELKKAALGLTKLEGTAAKQAMACLNGLLMDLGQLNVRTIDSLLHQIVRAAALSLGLHPDFQPAFDSADALAPYLEGFMRRAESGDERALALLAKAVQAYLNHMGENKKIFLPGRELLGGINSYLDDVFCGRDAGLASGTQVEARLENYVKTAQRAATLLLEELDGLEERSGISLHKNARNAIEGVARGYFSDSAFNRKNSVLELLKKSGSSPDNTSLLEELYAGYKAAVKKLIDFKKPFEAYLRDYPIIELARLLVAEHDGDRQKGNTLPASLIPQLAARALDIDNGVCEAICRLGSRLSHFLVDEFQDTSIGQWQAFRPLVVEGLARGGALTWVGDVKQSIYGWRGASPELFDALLEDTGLTAMTESPQILSLDYNRRSARLLIEHNNRIFSQLAHPETAEPIANCLLPKDFAQMEEIALRVAANFRNSAQEIPAGARDAGLVRLECLGKKRDEFEEAFSVRLVELLKNDLYPARRWSEILILVRRNSEAAALASLLLSEDIPVLTENSLLLAGHPLLEQSLALLEFIANPRDEEALQILLTGSIIAGCEASRDEAENLAECALIRGDQDLADYVRCRYPAIWEELLAPFLERSKMMTPYDTIREWYRKLRVEQRFPEECIFLRSFMELLHGAELRGLVSVNDFLDYWRRNAERSGHEPRAHMPEGLDAVKIMTIHKAKGLQAPVVILPLPAQDLQVKSARHDSNVTRNFDGMLLNVPLLKDYSEEYNQALIRDALETLDIIYVGFTRPQEALYIFTTDDPASPLAALAENAGLGFPYTFGVEPKKNHASPASLATVPPAPPPRAEMAWEQPMGWLPNLKIASSWPANGKHAGEENDQENPFHANLRGSLLHFCLEHMHIGDNPEQAAAQALAFGLAHSGLDVSPSESELLEMRESLCWFASQKNAASWLYEGWKEQPLLDGAGRERRVDLVLPQPWGALVVEYKSGGIMAKHEEQLRSYMACLEASGQFPGLIRGLLVYLDQRKFYLIAGGEAARESAVCPNFP